MSAPDCDYLHVELWHQSERVLVPGDTIEPGRWGRTVLASGEHHPFFFREVLLELWRVSQTQVRQSRLDCTFAFVWCLARGEHVLGRKPISQKPKVFHAEGRSAN